MIDELQTGFNDMRDIEKSNTLVNHWVHIHWDTQASNMTATRS